MTLVENLRDAVGSISANPLRSALTMLGVIIGVAALVAMLSIGAGAQARIAAQVRALGANVLVIFPEVRGNAAERRARPVDLDVADANAIGSQIPTIATASPALETEAVVVRGARNWSTRVTGTTAEHFTIREWGLNSGRVFSRREEENAGKVAVIGATVAARLFGADDPAGAEIRIRSTPFEVIGVLAEKGRAGGNSDQDDAVFVPYGAARLRLGARSTGVTPEPVSYILAKAASDEALASAKQDVDALIRQRHRIAPGGDPGFRISEPAATIELQRGSSDTVALLLAIIASISMVVGGIGILNIMLVSVSERTKEIGLRVALGAKRREIARLFLTEALLICLGGGLVGVAAGAGISWSISHYAGWPVLIAPETPLAALAFATAIGLIFGYYPARKAARMPPAEALRAA